MGKLLAADLFCGAGGTTQGAESSGAVKTIFAVNHWDLAVEAHSRNFPHAKHVRCDVDKVHPSECGKIHILLASPPCPGHTHARGNKPTSDQQRSDAWDIMKWFEFHRMPEAVIENVPGFLNWGPVNPDTGRPIEKFKGKFFESWVGAIQSAGYKVEWRILNSADFGALTSRRRLIVRARKGNKPPAWPELTHVDQWRSAREAIDLNHTGRPIAGRIVDSTLARIADGRSRFGNSFIVEYYGNSTSVSLDCPLPTITTRDRHGLVVGDTLRMLSNAELAKAQGFPESYYFAGKRQDITKQIGNSVPPILSKVICSAIAGV